MRNIKELLELMLLNKQLFSTGLCDWAASLYDCEEIITYNELNKLLEYIQNNRPKWYSSIEAFKHRNSIYYWLLGNITPRIKWIEKHIKKNS